MVDPYRQQVAPQRTVGLGPAPQSLLAPVGAALDVVAREFADANIQRTALETERRRDKQLTDFSVGFEAFQTEMETAAAEAQQNAPAGGEGYSKARLTHFDERAKALGTGITDPKVQALVQRQLAQYRSRYAIAADRTERGLHVGSMVTNTATAVETAGNGLVGKSADDWATKRLEFHERIDALALPADTKAKLKRETDQKLTVTWLGGLDPARQIEMLNGNGLDDILDPQQKERLRAGAQADIARAEVQARAQAAAQKADAKELIDGVQRRLRDGFPVSDAEVAKAEEVAQAFGLAGDAYDLAKGRVQQSLNRQFEAATPAQIDAALKEVTAKIAKAGDKATPQDIMTRDHLTTLLPRRTAEIERDPMAYGARLGIGFAPVNPADPASLDRRRAAVDKVAAISGTPPRYLSDEEATLLRGDGSPAAVLQAIGVARGFGGRAAGQVMEQLLPGDAVALHASGLPAPIARAAIEGRALKGKAVKLPPSTGEEVRKALGDALRYLPPAARNAVAETAASIYAFHAGRDGKPDDKLDKAVLTRSVHQALGGDGAGRGGLGNWRGKPVVLPDGWRQAELDYFMANRAPEARMEDGRTIRPSELRRHYTPVMQRPGVYWFVDDDGGVAMAGNGKPMALKIGR